MGDLDEALAGITQIRTQIARTAEFRGYGPVTLAATGFFGVLAGGLQFWLIDLPLTNIMAYLTIWLTTAALAVFVVGGEMVWRARRLHFGLAPEMVWSAMEQFLPVVGAGLLLTFVLMRHAPQTLWMLPGLWQILFSLGLFASCRFLPRGVYCVALWYLATGLACLAWTGGDDALSPWAMAVPFGVGQCLFAAMLSQRFGGGVNVA